MLALEFLTTSGWLMETHLKTSYSLFSAIANTYEISSVGNPLHLVPDDGMATPAKLEWVKFDYSNNSSHVVAGRDFFQFSMLRDWRALRWFYGFDH